MAAIDGTLQNAHRVSPVDDRAVAQLAIAVALPSTGGAVMDHGAGVVPAPGVIVGAIRTMTLKRTESERRSPPRETVWDSQAP